MIHWFKLHYWPALLCIWVIFTFATSYSISILNGHVQELIPFISDTGERAPESCFFGQMLNIGAIIMVVTMYIRYHQVELAINSNEINLKRRWSTVAFWSGNVVCLGVSIVGNFQKATFMSMHFLGAFMAFGVAIIYFLAQTRISYAFNPFYDKYPEYKISTNVTYYRLFLWIAYILLFITTVTCGVISVRKIKVPRKEFPGWTKQTDGFEIHLIATISEWMMLFIFLLYTLTGTKEFKTIEYNKSYFKKRNCNVIP